MPSFPLVPLLVKEHCGGGAAEMAIMEGVAGAAMIAGGLALAAISPKRHIRWVLEDFAASCFPLALAAAVPGNMLWAAVAFRASAASPS